MTTWPAKPINHFTHPNHVLYQINYGDKEYGCDGCKTPGSGTAYRCSECNFDLHEYCATCPSTLSSFMHPQHRLDLLTRTPEDIRLNKRVCDLCGDVVQHLFYRCNLCDFDVHPICTQLPQSLRHVLHPEHPLVLQPFSSTGCKVCKSECSSWRYRCGTCCFDIHLECVLASCDDASTRCLSVGRPVHPPPAFGGYNTYGGQQQQVPYSFGGYPYAASSGFSPYNTYYDQHQHQYPYSNQSSRRKKMYKFVGRLALGVITSGLFS